MIRYQASVGRARLTTDTAAALVHGQAAARQPRVRIAIASAISKAGTTKIRLP
jgi:hypothetical protein